MTAKATPTRRFADVINVCPDCNHDVVLGEEHEHDACDVNLTALVEEGLAEREAMALAAYRADEEVMRNAA